MFSLKAIIRKWLGLDTSLVWESLFEGRCGPYFIRVWQKEKGPGEADHKRFIQLCAHLADQSPAAIVEAFSKLKDVNRVQVQISPGKSLLIYPEWP